LEGRRNPFVAHEGIPFLVLAAAAFGVSLRYLDAIFVVVAALLLVVLFLVFRDPRRIIPASPLGVVSPVDGRIIKVDLVDKGVLQGEAHRIQIRINSLGSYTARAPVEGKISDLRSVTREQVVDYRTTAVVRTLWRARRPGAALCLSSPGPHRRIALADRKQDPGQTRAVGRRRYPINRQIDAQLVLLQCDIDQGAVADYWSSSTPAGKTQ